MKRFILIVLLAFTLTSCKCQDYIDWVNNVQIVDPTLTTASITAITGSTATGGGNITDDGGTAITARGVCWSTSSSPTTADSKTTDGTGEGSFSSSLTGLTCGTLYYVRAYATNSTGTYYGNEVSFTTQSGIIRLIFYSKIQDKCNGNANITITDLTTAQQACTALTNCGYGGGTSVSTSYANSLAVDSYVFNQNTCNVTTFATGYYLALDSANLLWYTVQVTSGKITYIVYCTNYHT